MRSTVLSGVAVAITLFIGTGIVDAAAPLTGPTGGLRFDNPSWSPNGRWMAVTDGNRDGMFLYNAADRSLTRITDAPSSGYAHNWSGDGTRLGFKLLLTAGGAPTAQVPVFFDAEKQQVVTLSQAAQRAGVPSFSNDGKIAFTIGDELRIVDRVGTPLQSIPLGHYVNLAPISPDGTKVAYNGTDEQIWVVNLATGDKQRLTSDENAYFNPVWSPDSAKLLISTVAGQLKTIELATGRIHDLGPGSSPSWSPDSISVTYSVVERTDGLNVRSASIRQSRFDGTGATTLSDPAQPLIAPRMSPDGRRIVFVSLATGAVQDAPLLAKSGAGLAAHDATGAGLGSPATLLSASTSFRDWSGGAASFAAVKEAGQPSTFLATQIRLTRTVPYIHQVYDTPDDFNGNWACNGTSAMMCLAYYEKLPYWDCTCSTPYSHVSHYGRYISQIYTFNGYTYNIGSPDPSGDLGYGGYGYIVRNDWADTKGYMRDYFINHAVSSSVDWSPTWTELKNEINSQYPLVLLNSLTTAGHYIVPIGYFDTQYTAVFNDPYGNKNSGYMNYSGAGACYDWPGYNNGYQNLNTVHCFIYARATVPQTVPALLVESRNGGQNFAKYAETGTWADTATKSTAAGVTTGIGSRYGSTYRSVASEKHALFSADIATAGSYEVFATWGAGSNRRSPILHRITHAGGTTDVNVDQTAAASTWVSLGTYNFAAGTDAGRVDVSNLNIDASGSMYADAVKWEYRGATPPTITQHPAAQNVCPGTTAAFTVAASGSGTLTYQWQKNSANLSNGGHYSGVTTTTLTVSSADAADVANYRCVVTNAGGNTNSNAAALTLKAATAITQQPIPQSVCPLQTVQLSVTATGTAPLTYQWQKGGNNLSNGGHYSGVTTATMTITGMDRGDATVYRCVVTGGCGTATSSDAIMALTVNTIINQHPASKVIHRGKTAQFSVLASGDGQITYRWQRDGADLYDGGHCTGCATPTLTVSNADGSDAGAYRCIATAGCGTATSNAATLTLTTAADFDVDGDVDGGDFGILAGCFNGTGNAVTGECLTADLNGDNSVDGIDYGLFAGCFNGTGNPPACL